MIKVKALKTFADKHTGKKHIPGDVWDVTVERCNELIEKGGYITILGVVPASNNTKKEEK